MKKPRCKKSFVRVLLLLTTTLSMIISMPTYANEQKIASADEPVIEVYSEVRIDLPKETLEELQVPVSPKAADGITNVNL